MVYIILHLIKRLITLNNIQKLIKYCLYPENTMNKFSQNFLRFPYYSCRILCSSCVLNFEKSLENIKKANNPDNKEENKEESESNKTDINNEKIYSENENVIEEVRKNNFSENNNIFIPVIEEIGDKMTVVRSKSDANVYKCSYKDKLIEKVVK